MKSRYALCLALMVAATGSQASEFDLNLSDDSANASVTITPANRSIDFGAGYIYQEGGTHIANLDFHARGRTAIGNLPTTVGIGAQFNWFDEDPVDGGAIGIGGFTRINIPTVPGLGVNLSAYYAPSITSFGDADHFYRWDANLTYRIIQNADVYLGYREVRVDLEHASYITLNDGLIAGFTIHF